MPWTRSWQPTGGGRGSRRSSSTTREDDHVELRRALLKELFGNSGVNLWVEPPFYCDYGSNIYAGDNVFFNFNCVILDVAEVTIGSDTMFGPAVQLYTATHPIEARERLKGCSPRSHHS